MDENQEVVDVEVPVPAADIAETAEKDSEPAPENEPHADTAEDAKAREQRAIQKRIDRLTREKYELKAKADFYESMHAPRQEPQDGKPKSTDYGSTDEFVEALTDWKLSQRDRASQQNEVRRVQETVAQKAEKLFSAVEKEGTFDRDDFSENVKITDVMAEAILDSDLGAKLVLHFNSNPDDAGRIAGLSPARQAAEIGRLEAKLSAAPKVSKAPPPIDPVGSGKTTTRNLESASMEDYIAMRKKQGARWA